MFASRGIAKFTNFHYRHVRSLCYIKTALQVFRFTMIIVVKICLKIFTLTMILHPFEITEALDDYWQYITTILEHMMDDLQVRHITLICLDENFEGKEKDIFFFKT